MIARWTLDLRRAVYSLWVLVRHGAVPLIRYLLHQPLDEQTVGLRLRQIFETLGLTYVKLGQYLASRLDLLPEEMRGELRHLFERAKPVAYERIRAVVEADLGRPLEELFLDLSRTPIAAASVAQVHEAHTLAGEHVAVKVQRPGIAAFFAADMRNLGRFAALLDALGVMGTVSTREVLGEFARWTTRELHFVTEGRTADRLRRESPPFGTVPRVHWGLTSHRVLTLEFIHGSSLARIMELLESGRQNVLAEQYPDLDLRKVGENLAFIVMHQLFVTGFFHGDPHPGNIFVRGDNTVVLLDCGIFGELPDDQREYLAGHIENAAIGDIDASFRYYMKQLTPTDETDLRAFERDAKEVLRGWHEKAMTPNARPGDRHLGKYGGAMLSVVRRHHVRISPETLLFWRSLEALDATALRFSRYFDLLSSMQSFFESIRPSPSERLWQTASDPNVWLNVRQVARGALDYAEGVLGQLSGRGRPAVLAQETLAMRRARDRRTKRAALPVLALGVAVLLPAESPAALIVAAVATVILADMVRTLARRDRI